MESVTLDAIVIDVLEDKTSDLTLRLIASLNSQ